MAEKEKQSKILSTKHAIIYALGIFGVQIFIGFMNSFQTEFYNKMYSGFDGNIFYASAIIILLAKIISCISLQEYHIAPAASFPPTVGVRPRTAGSVPFSRALR